MLFRRDNDNTCSASVITLAFECMTGVASSFPRSVRSSSNSPSIDEHVVDPSCLEFISIGLWSGHSQVLVWVDFEEGV